ncbi:OmpA family protein [Tellurirhabdus bombi]|uniref:OmpA family protein n=1 Tax=Tellurirhabdus bombi TaxID=2907205 RepID=UPI001F1F06B1|nr:OmpA family protein [Tellurirhabdus bombi]
MKKVSLFVKAMGLGLLASASAFAQYNPKASYEGPAKMNTWSVSIHGGPTQFFGDLREYDFYPVGNTNSDSYSERGTWFVGAAVGKQLSHLFGLQLGANLGNLAGMKRRQYFSYFRSNYQQVDLTGSVNLKSLLFGPNKMKHWKIDGYTGIGVLRFKSTAYQLGSGRVQRFTKHNAGDGTVTPAGYEADWVIPIGAAIHYEISPRFDIGLDFRINHVNTERLDATIGGDNSSVYDQVGSRGSFDNTLARKGSSSLDKYGYGSFMVTYKLGKNAIRVKKENGKYEYDTTKGTYHLRWTDPRNLIKPPVILTLEQIDSVAKANRPKDIDPRLLLDSDNDGVSDYFDRQPNTPAGSIVSGAGEAIDFDKYVSAALPGIACAEIFANVQFDTDKNIIKPQYYEMLNKVVELLNKTQCRLQLSGHADRRASDRYNIALSRRRVEAVRNYLVKAGLNDANRIVIDAFGSFKPIGDTSRNGLQKNRRVELRLVP